MHINTDSGSYTLAIVDCLLILYLNAACGTHWNRYSNKYPCKTLHQIFINFIPQTCKKQHLLLIITT